MLEELKADNKLLESLDFGHEEDIIDGFVSRYNVSIEEAEEILDETKKWLWLASQTQNDDVTGLVMDKPLMIIDEMWHNFILYTKHYQKFCLERLNKFIHHIPTPSWAKKDMEILSSDNINSEIDKINEDKYKQLSFIYDKLGPETVIKWYEEYPSKYTPDYIASIRK